MLVVTVGNVLDSPSGKRYGYVLPQNSSQVQRTCPTHFSFVIPGIIPLHNPQLLFN